MDTKLSKELKNFAIDIRENIIHQLDIRGFGHVGGSMSITEFIAVLYGLDLNVDPKNPDKKDRDLLVVSKGHAGPAVYAALALKGFFPMEWLDTLNQPHTNLPSHCDRTKTPGVDMTTGSLGQGLSVASGMAFAAKVDDPSRTVYCVIGDGEMQEGQIWEAMLFAAHQKLGNLVAVVDYNKVQLDGTVEEICGLEDLSGKFASFGWHTQSIDGHSVEEIHDAIVKAKTMRDMPNVIILNTIKGKDCAFANPLDCHHVNVSHEQATEAMEYFKKLRSELNA